MSHPFERYFLPSEVNTWLFVLCKIYVVSISQLFNCYKNLVLSNELIKVEITTVKDLEIFFGFGNVSSVSPSSERNYLFNCYLKTVSFSCLGTKRKNITVENLAKSYLKSISFNC